MRAASFLFYCIVGSVLYLSFSVYYLSEDEEMYPILLWWTDFVMHQETITCNNSRKCVISGNRQHLDHDNMKALLFYGTLLDLKDMPTRKDWIYWSLFHEESPKNQPALRNVKLQRLFNITATFSRHSTFPIGLQYLKGLNALSSDEYVIGVQEKNRLIKEEGLAPVFYMQSACDTPINRDHYVKELMKFIKVDSYGSCLNNKELPEALALKNQTIRMYSEPLLQLSAKYKFVIAIENAKCDDYVTEKLWRPLMVGAIPIYLGASTIKDYLPNNKSAILIQHFASIESLAAHILAVHKDDALYESYMSHKHLKNIDNQRLLKAYASGGTFGQASYFDDVIPAFQCFVCDAVHEKRVFPVNTHNVYNCEYPEDKSWHFSWKQGENDAKQLA